MARFLIAVTPIGGHIEPALIVARALLARGHEVGWYTGQRFQAKIEAAGVRFFPIKNTLDYDDRDLDAYFPARKGLKDLNELKYDMKHIFVDAGPGQVQDLIEICREFPADVILADFTFAGAGLYHEKGGPAWALLGHAPLALSSRDTAPFGLCIWPNASGFGHLRNQTLNWLLKTLIFRDVISHTDKMRTSIGLAPKHANPIDTQLSPYLWLQGTIPEFEYSRSDLPPQVHFVGPYLPPSPENFNRPGWWSDLEADRPVVHVTQGTIETNPEELLIPTIEGLAGENVLVVATTGGKPTDTLKLNGATPENLRLEQFIPHYRLLPHVDVMITNGGYNGVQIALENGVPLVVNGRTQDKPEVANRVAYAGVGLNLKAKKVTPEMVREAVKKILADPGYRQKARQIQAKYKQYDAAARSAGLLEKLAATKQPVFSDATFNES